jgi:GGDEF domain-containing protein
VARVHECLAEHNHWYDGADLSLAIGASTGGKGSSLVELFKRADQQMYKEKGNSRKTASENKIENKFGNPPQNN